LTLYRQVNADAYASGGLMYRTSIDNGGNDVQLYEACYHFSVCNMGKVVGTDLITNQVLVCYPYFLVISLDLTGIPSAGSSSSQGESASGSIILPGELFSKFPGENLDVVFGVYENAGLFPRNQMGSFQIASSVLSTSVSGKSISNLTEEVAVTMLLESEVRPNVHFILNLSGFMFT